MNNLSLPERGRKENQLVVGLIITNRRTGKFIGVAIVGLYPWGAISMYAGRGESLSALELVSKEWGITSSHSLAVETDRRTDRILVRIIGLSLDFFPSIFPYFSALFALLGDILFNSRNPHQLGEKK